MESECGIKCCKAGQRDILPQIVAVPPNSGRLRPMEEVCRRERKVIALEITNPFGENCRQIRPQFEPLAKDFEGVPFISVLTGPFITVGSAHFICYMSVFNM